MKYYTVESYAEKEAPFGIAWQVKLFDGHTLLEEYDHIFYNEIAGYCKISRRVLMKSRRRLRCWKILQKV